LGEEYYDAEMRKPAVAALNKSLQLDPDDPSAWYYLSLAATRAEAREACKRFLKLEPSGRRALEIRRRLARLR
jgi:cytochrome c-type biogenesis protein CcmH/NrfG